jgi:uncharacterized integral membrane protein
MGSYVKGIILVFVLLFFITFGVKNSQLIQLYYYLNFETGAFPLYGLAYLCIVIGIVIGMIVGIYDRIDLRRTVKRLRRENRELKERVVEEEEEQGPVASPLEKEGEAPVTAAIEEKGKME